MRKPVLPVVPNHLSRGIRLEKFGHLKRGVWHAELVGVVRSYPPTQERFDELLAIRRANIARLKAEGRWTREGVNNGNSRRHHQIDRADKRKAHTIALNEARQRRQDRIKAHRAALEAAPAEVKRMMDENFINAENLTDAESGNIALRFVTAVVLDDQQSMKDRLTAVKILAEFTKAKPVSKQEVAFKNSEDFLASLLPKAE